MPTYQVIYNIIIFDEATVEAESQEEAEREADKIIRRLYPYGDAFDVDEIIEHPEEEE